MKTKTIFQFASIFLLSSSILVACTSEVKKTTTVDSNVKTTTVDSTVNDSVPPLANDSDAVKKPENMKSGAAKAN